MKKKSLLVDSSRDGGAWWFPQPKRSRLFPQMQPKFDPNAPHQGKALADYLLSLGYKVTELPRSERKIFGKGLVTIDSAFLTKHDLVIRANESGRAYSPTEINAYKHYVENGGRLLLISHYLRGGRTDTLASAFGLKFTGISRGENVVNKFVSHPITQGVSKLSYKVGSGLVNYPTEAQIIGWLSDRTYLDLNDNQMHDPNEPFEAPVLGYLYYGTGKIVFFGNVLTIEQIPQPFTDNYLNWFFE